MESVFESSSPAIWMKRFIFKKIKNLAIAFPLIIVYIHNWSRLDCREETEFGFSKRNFFAKTIIPSKMVLNGNWFHFMFDTDFFPKFERLIMIAGSVRRSVLYRFEAKASNWWRIRFPDGWTHGSSSQKVSTTSRSPVVSDQLCKVSFQTSRLDTFSTTTPDYYRPFQLVFTIYSNFSHRLVVYLIVTLHFHVWAFGTTNLEV